MLRTWLLENAEAFKKEVPLLNSSTATLRDETVFA
jgi:hypothetical protein